MNSVWCEDVKFRAKIDSTIGKGELRTLYKPDDPLAGKIMLVIFDNGEITLMHIKCGELATVEPIFRGSRDEGLAILKQDYGIDCELRRIQ